MILQVRLWCLLGLLRIEPIQLIGQLIDIEFLQLSDKTLIFGQPRGQLLARDPLLRLHLAQSLDQQHKRRTVISTFLQGCQTLLQFGIVELVIRIVKFGRVGKGGRIETGQSHRERLIDRKISRLVQFSKAYILELFRRQVRSLLLKHSLHVIGLLVGPTELGGHPHLPLRTDEHVLRPNVADLVACRVKCLPCRDDRVNKVPQLRLFEKLALHVAPVHHLVAQQIRIVFVCDLRKK